MYRTTIPNLSARGFATAAPDLPGHGAIVALGPFSFERSRTQLSTALQEHRRAHPDQQVMLVGVSLGGQEMPRMPMDEDWLQVIGEDVVIVRVENAQGIQAATFGFEFEPPAGEMLPPVLVVVGENDVAMARWDFGAAGVIRNGGEVSG